MSDYPLPAGFFREDGQTKRAVSRDMDQLVRENPGLTATEIAETVAWDRACSDWLDDPDHWVWDLALTKVSD